MKRLTISLNDGLAEELELIAWATGDSQSAVVQYALSHYFNFKDVRDGIAWARNKRSSAPTAKAAPAPKKPATPRKPK